MKKTLHLIVLLFLFAGEMYANRINVEDAFTIASEFLEINPDYKKLRPTMHLCDWPKHQMVTMPLPEARMEALLS